jgi:hypothetical protein
MAAVEEADQGVLGLEVEVEGSPACEGGSPAIEEGLEEGLPRGSGSAEVAYRGGRGGICVAGHGWQRQAVGPAMEARGHS